MVLEGNIENFPIADILQVLASGRKSGELTLEGDVEKISIMFKEGKAVYSQPIRNIEILGELFIRDGVTTRQNLEEAENMQKLYGISGEKKPIGEILLEMGLISKETLQEYLRHQIKESIVSFLSESKGVFFFKEFKVVDGLGFGVEIDVEKVMFEGMRTIEERKYLKELIPSDKIIFWRNGKSSNKVTGEPNQFENSVLELINGKRTFGEIVELLRAPAYEVLVALYNLMCFGFVQKDE